MQEVVGSTPTWPTKERIKWNINVKNVVDMEWFPRAEGLRSLVRLVLAGETITKERAVPVVDMERFPQAEDLKLPVQRAQALIQYEKEMYVRRQVQGYL